MTVLIIDDNEALANAIRKNLLCRGYDTETASDGKKGLRMALEKEYDIILLDIMMPQMNGYKVLKSLRDEGRKTPVIMITAKDGISDSIDGLDLGADDYIQKPFNMDVLCARIRAVVRRSSRSDNDSDMIRYADITLTGSTRKLAKNEIRITLSATEYELLRYLIKNSSVIVSADKLAQVTEDGTLAEEEINSSMENIIKRLRYVCSDVRILNIKGAGYKLCS